MRRWGISVATWITQIIVLSVPVELDVRLLSLTRMIRWKVDVNPQTQNQSNFTSTRPSSPTPRSFPSSTPCTTPLRRTARVGTPAPNTAPPSSITRPSRKRKLRKSRRRRMSSGGRARSARRFWKQGGGGMRRSIISCIWIRIPAGMSVRRIM